MRPPVVRAAAAPLDPRHPRHLVRGNLQASPPQGLRDVLQVERQAEDLAVHAHPPTARRPVQARIRGRAVEGVWGVRPGRRRRGRGRSGVAVDKAAGVLVVVVVGFVALYRSARRMSDSRTTPPRPLGGVYAAHSGEIERIQEGPGEGFDDLAPGPRGDRPGLTQQAPG